MKTLKLLIALCCVLLQFSCSEKENYNEIDEDLLIGSWGLDAVSFNGTEKDKIEFGAYFNFHSNGVSDRNYITADWSVLEDRLSFVPVSEGLSSRDYEILFLSDEKLVLKIMLTESEYSNPFDQSQDQEDLIIVETYLKN